MVTQPDNDVRESSALLEDAERPNLPKRLEEPYEGWCPWFLAVWWDSKASYPYKPWFHVLLCLKFENLVTTVWCFFYLFIGNQFGRTLSNWQYAQHRSSHPEAYFVVPEADLQSGAPLDFSKLEPHGLRDLGVTLGEQVNEWILGYQPYNSKQEKGGLIERYYHYAIALVGCSSLLLLLRDRKPGAPPIATFNAIRWAGPVAIALCMLKDVAINVTIMPPIEAGRPPMPEYFNQPSPWMAFSERMRRGDMEPSTDYPDMMWSGHVSNMILMATVTTILQPRMHLPLILEPLHKVLVWFCAVVTSFLIVFRKSHWSVDVWMAWVVTIPLATHQCWQTAPCSRPHTEEMALLDEIKPDEIQLEPVTSEDLTAKDTVTPKKTM